MKIDYKNTKFDTLLFCDNDVNLEREFLRRLSNKQKNGTLDLSSNEQLLSLLQKSKQDIQKKELTFVFKNTKYNLGSFCEDFGFNYTKLSSDIHELGLENNPKGIENYLLGLTVSNPQNKVLAKITYEGEIALIDGELNSYNSIVYVSEYDAYFKHNGEMYELQHSKKYTLGVAHCEILHKCITLAITTNNEREMRHMIKFWGVLFKSNEQFIKTFCAIYDKYELGTNYMSNCCAKAQGNLYAIIGMASCFEGFCDTLKKILKNEFTFEKSFDNISSMVRSNELSRFKCMVLLKESDLKPWQIVAYVHILVLLNPKHKRLQKLLLNLKSCFVTMDY